MIGENILLLTRSSHWSSRLTIATLLPALWCSVTSVYYPMQTACSGRGTAVIGSGLQEHPGGSEECPVPRAAKAEGLSFFLGARLFLSGFGARLFLSGFAHFCTDVLSIEVSARMQLGVLG